MDDREKNRREDIIQAALRVFATEGFHKASIKRIAKEAGLKSPSLIYWYFKDKDELLDAVMGSVMPVFDLAVNGEAFLDQPPEVVLPMVVKGYFALFTNTREMHLMKIFLSEALHTQETVEALSNRLVSILHFLTAYLERQIALGRLRPHNVQSSTRALVGMLLIYMLTHEIIPQLSEGLPEIEQYGEDVASIFLSGLRP